LKKKGDLPTESPNKRKNQLIFPLKGVHLKEGRESSTHNLTEALSDQNLLIEFEPNSTSEGNCPQFQPNENYEVNQPQVDTSTPTSQRSLRSKGKPSITKLLELYGCKTLNKSDRELTKRFLSMVHGGRTKNENPYKVRHDDLVISMDIVSCYGRGIEDLALPIGHPALFYYSHKRTNEWPTLRLFLNKYRDQLVPGCYYIVVDTCGEILNTSQNLIFSKIFDNDNPEIDEHAKDSDSSRDDSAHIKGDFVLLENEVRNGILTHFSLTALERFASNPEQHELFTKLRVKTAMFYPKDLCIEYTGPESVERWIDAVRKTKGRLNTWGNTHGHGIDDSRVGPTLLLPVKEYIRVLLNERRKIKEQMKAHPKGSAEWNRLNSIQLYLKKLINTLYGTIASVHFPISSPCLANNITDRARTGCWIMSMCGAGLTSITDGCEGLLNNVRFINPEWTPSLTTIARLQRPDKLNKKTRSRYKTAPLGSKGDQGQRWSVDDKGMITGPGLEEPVDASTAKLHIEKLYHSHFINSLESYETLFIEHGSLHTSVSAEGSMFTVRSPDGTTHRVRVGPLSWCIPLKFECKHLGDGIALHGSADYAIGCLPSDPDLPLIKARGHRLYDNHYNPRSGEKMPSPMLTLMKSRLEGEETFGGVTASFFKPVSVGEYNTRIAVRVAGGLPGDLVARSVTPKLITPAEFRFNTVDTYKAWKNHYKFLTLKYGRGLEIAHDIYDFMSVEQIESAKVKIQNAIDAGHRPVSRHVTCTLDNDVEDTDDDDDIE